MGRDLSKRYSLPTEKTGVKNPISFLLDVYSYGKSRELVSFIIWELMHRLRLFPKDKYLKFDNNKALTLENERLNDLDFRDEIIHAFSSRGLSISRAGHNWKVLCIKNNKEILGCLYPDDRDLYKSIDNGKSITFIYRFPERIKSLFVTSQNTIFVCIEGAVYKNSDNSSSFKKSLDLGSSVSFFRHNNGMTETPSKTLVIAEYGNIWDKNGWRKLAYLYFSSDDGETWERSDFLLKQGTNKHVHLVKYSRLLNKLLMADGDNKKKLWISDSLNSSDLNPKWNPINKFHIQMGGYTSIAENKEKILFGTDYQGGTNFVVETRDGEKYDKRIVPDPYRRSPIMNMVRRKSKNGNEIWAYLPYSTSKTKCLLMYTVNGGESWNKVIEYRGSTHKVWLVSSSNEPADELYFSIEDLKNCERVVYKIMTDNDNNQEGQK
jgi:hypothetical protein